MFDWFQFVERCVHYWVVHIRLRTITSSAKQSKILCYTVYSNMVTNNDNNYKYLRINTYLNLNLILWKNCVYIILIFSNKTRLKNEEIAAMTSSSRN